MHDCTVGLVACTESDGLLHDVDFIGNLIYDCRGPGMTVAKWVSERMTHRILRVSYLNDTVVDCSGPSKNGGIWSGGMLMENDQAEDVTVMNNVLSGNGYAQFRVILNLSPKRIVTKNNLIDGLGENLTRGNLVRKAPLEDAAEKDLAGGGLAESRIGSLVARLGRHGRGGPSWEEGRFRSL